MGKACPKAPEDARRAPEGLCPPLGNVYEHVKRLKMNSNEIAFSNTIRFVGDFPTWLPIWWLPF